METRCVKIKLKPDSLERVRAWAAELNRRRDEVLATLRDESVVLEAAFLDRTKEGDFLLYVMTAESFEQAREAVRHSTHAIDAYHQQFKRDTWDSTAQLERLLDIERIREV